MVTSKNTTHVYTRFSDDVLPQKQASAPGDVDVLEQGSSSRGRTDDSAASAFTVHGTPPPQPPLYSIVQVYPNVTHKSRVITNRGDGIFNVC